MTDPAPPPPTRPPTSSAASWLSAIVALLALTAFCCVGLGVFSLRTAVSLQADAVRGEAEDLRERARRLDETEALLDEIGLHLGATRDQERMYPHALPEAPPADGWGTDLRYERAGPDRAWLTSAGPDRRFGTADDLVRTLEGR